VELLKVLVVYEHPFLLKRARLQLFLAGTEKNRMRFVAYHHNRSEGWEAFVPHGIVEDLKSRAKDLRKWVRSAHKKQDLFDLPDSWVNFRRWTLRYDPLDALRTFALAVRAGKQIDLKDSGFKRMVKRLPRGNQLPAGAKQDLRTLFEYAKRRNSGPVQDQLLEVRFGVELEDEWGLNERPNDIDTIWQLLASVPVTNVEGNTQLREIDLTNGGGGVYGDAVIEIGEDELGNRERFEDTLRHEVGHAVHEELDSVVTPWLEKRFGWRMFPATPPGIDDWVRAMGGWGGVSGRERNEIVQALRAFAGPGSVWGPGKPPRLPQGHPWWNPDFGPRLACEKSRENWFETFAGWYRAGGNAFFVNYWYACFMAVSAETLDDYVARMPDNYAAMSQYEFFAELYALYYDYDDPQRGVVAGDPEVSGWLDRNIGRRDKTNPRAPGRRSKASGGQRRPKR
jgi:hypothetical protein